MPSVRGVGRQRAARRGRAAPRVAGGGSTRRTRGAPTPRTRRLATVSFGLSVHTEYTSRPPGRTARRGCDEQLALERGELGTSLGRTRQRASGRRRSTPSPVHGASSSTRSNVPVDARKLAAVGDDRHDERRQRARRAPRVIRAHARRVHVGRDDEPVVAHALGDAVALPPGAAATSSTRSPGCGSSTADDGLARLVLRRDAGRRATRAQRAEVAGVAHEQRVGHERRRARPRRRRAQLGGRRRRRWRAHAVHAQRDRRRFVVERRASRARPSRPSSSTSMLHDPVGMRRAHADRRRRRRRRAAATAGPVRASARSTPLTKPRARSLDDAPTVSPTAACGGTPDAAAGTRRAAARRARRDRASRAIAASTPCEQDSRARAACGRCRRRAR